MLSIATDSGLLINVTREEALKAGASESAIAAAIASMRKDVVKDECKRRIYAVASPETQMNMASMAAVIGAKTASARSEAEKQTLTAFEASLQWVQAMREAVAPLVADPKADFSADAAWPACPLEVLALAKSF